MLAPTPFEIDEAELDRDAGEPIPDIGRPVVEQALLLFQEWGLPLPPIPARLGDAVRQTGGGTFGTDARLPSLYDIGAHVDRLRGTPAEYLAFGHAGYGTVNWAMHLHVVLDSLALFIQIPWGGMTTSDDAATETVAAAFADAAELIDRVQRLAIPPGQRLVVVQSHRLASGWGLVPHGEAVGGRLAPSARALAAALAGAAQPAAPPTALPETFQVPRPSGPVWG